MQATGSTWPFSESSVDRFITESFWCDGSLMFQKLMFELTLFCPLIIREGAKATSTVAAPTASSTTTTMVQRPQPPSKYMKWGGPKLGKPDKLTWHPLAGKNGMPTPGQ